MSVTELQGRGGFGILAVSSALCLALSSVAMAEQAANTQPNVILIIGDDMYIRNAHPQLPQICGLDAQCPQKELRAWARSGRLTPAQMDPLLEPRPAEELFNVVADPHQIKNVVDNPKYEEVLGDLRRLMDLWQRRTGDTVPPLGQATPDRYDRRTGKAIHGRGGRPKPGIVPGQTTGAETISDPGPR